MEEKFKVETEEDVQDILRLAIRKEPVAYADLNKRLLETAKELGISEHALEQAVKEHYEDQGLKKELAEFQEHRKRGFFSHLIPYVLVNAMLMTASLVDGEYWFVYPLFGWGIGIASHAYTVFYRRPDEHDPEFITWRAFRNAKIRP